MAGKVAKRALEDRCVVQALMEPLLQNRYNSPCLSGFLKKNPDHSKAGNGCASFTMVRVFFKKYEIVPISRLWSRG